MDADMQTPEGWLLKILPPDLRNHPLHKLRPYQHHKDHTDEFKPIYQALIGDIPFGGFSRLLAATIVSESELSSRTGMLMKDSE
jgi:hypothetical protein